MSSTFAKATGSIGCTVLALPMLTAFAIAALLGGLSVDGSVAASPSKQARADIPAYMLALYQRAAPTCPGLSWTVLAAIGKIETDHARHPTMISSAGAVGPIQFLPSTFTAYAHPVPPGGKKPPTPWDPVDAVYAASRLLCANGARDSKNLRRAIYAYNHAAWYVDDVLTVASRYGSAPPAAHRSAAQAVAFAQAQIGQPYVWGGDGPADGGFDCSGLTRAAYAHVGIHIPRLAQAQYDHGPHLARGTALAPGDLLFFGPSPHHITHVSLFAGHGQSIDAPHSGAVVRRGPARSDSPSFQGATRPANRP